MNGNLFDRLAGRALARHLQSIRGGRIQVVENGDDSFAGGEEHADLLAEVRVHRTRFYRRAVLGGSLGVAG